MSDSEFSLEKLKINDRLHAVELQVARLVSHMESEIGTFTRLQETANENFRVLREILNRHDKLFFGDGTPGILMKTDRLEQLEESRKWHFGAIWAGIIGIVTKIFYDIFKP